MAENCAGWPVQSCSAVMGQRNELSGTQAWRPARAGGCSAGQAVSGHVSCRPKAANVPVGRAAGAGAGGGGGETAEGMRAEVQAGSLQAGFSCQEGCREVVSGQAKGAHLPTRPGTEPSGCGWARGVLPCTRLTHQLPPQTAGAPFSGSSSLVPANVKAY